MSAAPPPRRRGQRTARLACLASILALGAALFGARGLFREWVLLRQLAEGNPTEKTVADLVQLGSVQAIPILLEIATTSEYAPIYLSENDPPEEPAQVERRARWGALAHAAEIALKTLVPRARERALPHLLEALQSPRAGVRAMTAGLVRTVGVRSAELARRLFAALQDADGDVQREAKQSLRGLGSEALPPFLAALRGSNDPIGEETLLIIDDLGDEARALTPALVARVSSDPAQRKALVTAIGNTGGSSLAAWRFLFAELSNRDDDCAEAAASALARASPGACPLAFLRKMLASAAPAERRRAAKVLQSMYTTPPIAVPELIERLHDSEAKVRAKVAETLGSIADGREDVVAALVGILHHPEDEVRESALWALGNLSDSVALPVAAVESMLEDTSADVRWKATRVLVEACGPEPRLLPACLEALGYEHPPDWAFSLAAGLGAAARDAVPRLAELLQEKSVNKSAARALGAIGPGAAAAVPALLDAMNTLNPEDFHAACGALVRIAPDEPTFLSQLHSTLRGTVAALRPLSASALWDAGEDRQEALEALVGSLGHADRSVRRAAVLGFTDLGHDAISPLLQSLSDPSPDARDAAAEALGRVGVGSAEVLEALDAHVLDGQGQLRNAVIQAIVKLGGDPTDVLLRALESTDATVRSSAVQEIWLRRLPCNAMRAALESALGEQKPWPRCAAAMSLLWIDPRHAAAGRALAEAVVQNEDGLNYFSTYGDLQVMMANVARRSPLAVEAVLAFAKDGWPCWSDNWSPRPAEDGSAPFVPPLAAALSRDDEATRYIAAHILKSAGPSGAPAVPALVERLDDPSPRVRSRAALTLGNIGPAAAPLATLALVRALGRRDDPILRSNAACALGDLGPDAREALPALVAIVLDERDDEILRCLALEAMAAMGGGAGLAGPSLESIAQQGDALRRYVELLRPELEAAPADSEARR